MMKTPEEMPAVKKIEVNDGKLDIQMVDEKGILQNFINEIVKIFFKSGGINYCGWTITHKKSGEQYEVIIQRKSGKTPSELKEEAAHRLIEATRILNNIKDYYKHPKKYGGAWPEWFEAEINEFLESRNES
jgi:DNA-directed RNA polymerase subunit L